MGGGSASPCPEEQLQHPLNVHVAMPVEGRSARCAAAPTTTPCPAWSAVLSRSCMVLLIVLACTPQTPKFFILVAMALEKSPSRVGRLGAEQAQCRAGVRRTDVFFARQSTVSLRFPSFSKTAVSLRPTLVAARPPAATLVRKFVSLRKRGMYCFAMAKRSLSLRTRNAAKVTGAVLGRKAVCKEACARKGTGASQLPGVQRGMGASQLWSWVLLFFFWGARGESASGGAKGNGGESALDCCCCLLSFFGGGGASQLLPLACPTFDTCQEGILSGRDFVRKEFC